MNLIIAYHIAINVHILYEYFSRHIHINTMVIKEIRDGWEGWKGHCDIEADAWRLWSQEILVESLFSQSVCS